MQDDCNQQFIKNRQILMNAVSGTLREHFKQINKSLKLFSREYEFADGQLSNLLRNKYQDIKLTTLWKLANALEIDPIEFLKMIRDKLPKNFNFYE